MGRRKGEIAIKMLKKHNIASFHSDKQMNTTLFFCKCVANFQ